jgi:hypothetical protein
VKQVSLSAQTAAIQPMVLFTPSDVGFYRYTAYISSSAPPQNAAWELLFKWTDLSGLQGANVLVPNLNSGSNFQQLPPYPFSPQPGTPVTFEVDGTNPPPQNSTFTFVFTIERLE